MFCPSCGTKIQDGVRFCSNCGVKIEEAILPHDDTDKQKATTSKKSWGFAMMFFLVVLSIMIPFVGIIVGFINKSVEGREKQSKVILAISFTIIFINIILVILSR